jgi:hypothetical protein
MSSFVAFLISTPWITLGMTGLVYLASIPYARVAYQRQRGLVGGMEDIDAGDEDEPHGSDESPV